MFFMNSCWASMARSNQGSITSNGVFEIKRVNLVIALGYLGIQFVDGLASSVSINAH
jgi:hypothetical protein